MTMGRKKMNYDNASLLLRYEAHDLSVYDPALQLLIMKESNGVFYRMGKTSRDEDGPDHFLQVGDTAMEAVRQILAEDRLYTLEKLETPKENWDGIHIYDFYFATEGRSVCYCGAQLEYVVGRKDFPKTNYLFDVLKRMGSILIPEGVPEDCFAPAKKSLNSPVRPVPVTIESFTVFDIDQTDVVRLLGDPVRDERLERYAFDIRSDGSIALTVQAGWPGSRGHRDGAGNSFALPEEWFAGTFSEFLEKLTERYSAVSCGFGKEELIEVSGLAEFLGFSDEKTDRAPFL